MRERQTADLDARIAIGGKMGPTLTATLDGGKKIDWYSGRIPGVIEEIFLTLQAGKPLYLCGAFGGAAATAIELLHYRVPREFSWEFQKQAPHAEAMRNLYIERGVEWLDYPDMAAIFAEFGPERSSAHVNHLSEEENEGNVSMSRHIEIDRTSLVRSHTRLTVAGLGLEANTCVCQKLNPDVGVMKSAGIACDLMIPTRRTERECGAS